MLIVIRMRHISRKALIWFSLVLSLLTTQAVRGQDATFKSISTLDGLNNGTINSISQDEHGNIWMATWDGLMKYDGYTVKTYLPVLGDSFLEAHLERYL